MFTLFSTTLRYDSRALRIPVAWGRIAGGLRVCVRDHGTGVAEDRVEDLFDRFVRPDLRHVESEGLGLSIVKRIIERQGGAVGYTPATGGGNEFWLTLPAADGAGAAAALNTPGATTDPAEPADPGR